MIKVYNNLGEKDKVASLCPRFVEEKVLNEEKIESDISNSDFHIETTCITSGNLVKLDILEEIGYYDEKLFIDKVDDEFCARADLKGYVHICVEGAILIHNIGDLEPVKIFNKVLFYPSNHSPLRRYYMTRNRLYFWEKYGKYSQFEKIIKIDKKAFLKEIIKGTSKNRI